MGPDWWATNSADPGQIKLETGEGFGGNGGSGVCVIRYLGGTAASGGTISSSGGYTYHTFTGTGTFTVS